MSVLVVTSTVVFLNVAVALRLSPEPPLTVRWNHCGANCHRAEIADCVELVVDFLHVGIERGAITRAENVV